MAMLTDNSAFGTAIVSQVFRFHDLFAMDRTYDAGVTFVWQYVASFQNLPTN